jgi:hypothetical protein
VAPPAAGAVVRRRAQVAPVVIDSHLHLVSFLQETVAPGDLADAVADLDGAVVFGLPVKKKWALTEPERPTYYLDDNAPCGGYSLTDELVATLVRSLPTEQQERVAPSICGFDPTDRLGVDHVERMIERYDGWRGVGEVLLRHDDLTELTYGENARAGHPALGPVLEVCRERGWPFLFHQDASSAGRGEGREYVGEVTTMLRDHPDVAQVWAHGGVSRRVHPRDHAALLDDLLGTHRHLHVDLSWVLFETVVVDDEVVPEWLDLVRRHPERFVLGSDAFGDLERQPGLLGRWSALSRRLAPSDRELVEHANARRLWWP